MFDTGPVELAVIMSEDVMKTGDVDIPVATKGWWDDFKSSALVQGWTNEVVGLIVGQ